MGGKLRNFYTSSYLVIILLLFHWSLNLQWFSLLFNFCFCCCYMFMQIVWNYWLENQFSFLFLNSSCFWSREQSRSHPNVCSVISHNSSFQDHCHLYSFRRFKLCSFHHFREETTFSAAFVENSLFCKHVFVFLRLSPTWPLVRVFSLSFDVCFIYLLFHLYLDHKLCLVHIYLLLHNLIFPIESRLIYLFLLNLLFLPLCSILDHWLSREISYFWSVDWLQKKTKVPFLQLSVFSIGIWLIWSICWLKFICLDGTFS